MNIAHVINSLDLSQGGPSKSVSDLAINQVKLGISVSILAKRSESPYLKKDQSSVQIYFSKTGLNRRELSKKLYKKNIDILHGHGLWQLPIHNMAKTGRDLGIKYIISPRGMLEPWALNTSKWKKKLAWALFQKKDLEMAACIHATALMEAENIRNLGLKNPIAIIPNGINIDEFPKKKNMTNSSRKTLLFLSRIHKKKGIENLIDAWSMVDDEIKKNWIVEIAGNGEEEYIETLNLKIRNRNLNSEIKIIGPQFGIKKIETYQRANLFVLPTHSENFGVVIAEALASEVPVITTKGTPWEDLNEFNAGKWIDIGVAPLTEALNEMLSLTDEERSRMGKNGRQLVKTKYSIEQVAQKMNHLYQWILGQSKKPDFIY